MRFYFATFLLLAIGVVYINYQISLSSEEESTRFIISQETQEALTANLLDEKLISKKKAIQAKEELDSVLDTIKSAPIEIPVDAHQVKEDPTTQEALTSMNDLSVAEEELAPVKNAQDSVIQAEPLTLVKSIPGGSISTWDTGKPLSFTFNQEVDAQTFFNNFLINPSVDGKFSGEITNKLDPITGNLDKKTIILKAVPTLNPGDYTITLKKGLASFDKQSKLEEDLQILFTIQ